MIISVLPLNDLKFQIVTFVIAFPLFASSQVDIDNLKDTNQKLYRQLMMLQLQTEECLRSTYDSGLLGMKQRTGGTRPYMSYPVEQSIPMCNTANRKGHVGLDSMNVLLNGVNFRTGAEGDLFDNLLGYDKVNLVYLLNV